MILWTNKQDLWKADEMLLCVIKTLNEAPAVIIATISLAGAGTTAFMKTNGLAINKLVEKENKTKLLQGLVVSF